MLSQFTQVAIILLLAVSYIRSPVLAQNDTDSSNSSSIDANSTANGTLENGVDSMLPTTVLLLSLGGVASLLNSLVVH